ncbi:MAG: inorganic phosphate transporter [Armatimonadetes bacterium]|nr:inorganic phosphate transporter [Armatimonadota bacterium]
MVGIIIVALVFDFINGFHDAANSIATVVATKVLTPLRAVIWAAFFNFVAAFGFKTHVAATIGKGVIDTQYVDPYVVLGALIGAIAWDIITWLGGLPTSSSHALIGGLVGAALAKTHAINVLVMSGIVKTVVFIFLAPMMGLAIGLAVMSTVCWICRNAPPGKVDKYFRSLQLVSAGGYSLGHGLNDAQKTMGIIWMLLLAGGYLSAEAPLPYWVILSCHAAIALGTMAGGWRIVHTMGLKITKLRPPGGFSAETAGAATIIGASMFGIPVSTTHTITGAIVGVGATRRLSAVRWGVAGRIVWAWILTIPMSALIGALAYALLKPFVG